MTIGFDRTKPASSFEEADFDDLRDFFEQSSIGMHWAAADGTILRANRADYEPLGYTAEEYIGRDLQTFDADGDLIAGVLDRLARGQRVENQPVRLMRKDGSIRHVLIDSSALFRDGELVHIRSVVRDDEGRTRAQDAMRRSDAVADLLPVLIAYIDKNERYVYNNRAYGEWFGKNRTDVTGRTLEEVLGKEARRAVAPYVEAALAGERVTFERQVQYFDGVVRWVRATYAGQRNAEGVQGFVAIVEDITERVRAMEAARESEQRYAFATRATRDVVWDWDLRAKYADWSPALTTEFGWAPVGMRTDNSWVDERVHPEDRDRVRELTQAAIDGAATHLEAEYRFQHVDGSWRAVHDRAFILRDGAGAAVRMVGSMADVTEQHLAEQSLRASEERYRTLTDVLPAYVAQFEGDGRAVFVNDRWLELTGRTHEQMQGFDWLEVIHPEDVPAIGREFQDAINEGRQAESVYRVRAADRTWRWMLGRAAPVRGADGAAVAWIGACTDITERFEAETALSESERRYRELVNALDVAVYTTDVDGLITHYNAAAVELWGREPQIGVDRWCGTWRLYWPDGRPMAHEDCPMAMALKEGRAVRGFEAIAERSDGTRVHFIPHPTPLYDSSGKLVGAVNVLVDITERKRAERELYAAEAQWRALTEQNPSLIVLTDLAGKAIHFNPAWKEYFARDVDEVEEWAWARLINAEDRDRLRDDFAAAWQNGEAFTCEYRACNHEGEDRWFQGSVTPVRDREGAITNWISVSIDIHDEKTATEALRKSEARQRAILETAEDGIITVDRAGLIESFNPAAERLFGYGADEVVGRDARILMPERDVSDHSGHLASYLRAGTPNIVGTGRDVLVRRKDGTLFPASLSVSEVDVEGVRSFTGIVHDLTDRQRAEEAVRQSEHRYRSLLDTMPAMVIAHKADGSVDEVSQTYEDYTGLTLEQAQDWQANEVVHPDDREHLATSWAEALAAGTPIHNRMRLRRRDGVYHWFAAEARPVRGADGSIMRWIAVCVDIDDQQRVEEAEREQRALIDAIFRGMPVGLAYIDLQNRFVRINEALAEMTGLPASELEGKAVQEVAPELFSILQPLFARALAGESINSVELTIEASGVGGGARHWIGGFHPVQAATGDIVGVAASVVEITDRKRAQDALAYQFGLTSTITDNASVGLLMTDREGRITFLNPAGESITGYRLEDVRGANAHEKLHYLHPDGAPYPASDCPTVQANIASEILADQDDVFVRPDGSFYNVRCNAAPIVRDEEQIGALIEIRDVTQEKRADARARYLAESSVVLSTTLEYDHMLADLTQRAVPAVADLAAAAVFGGDMESMRFGPAVIDPAQRDITASVQIRAWGAGDGTGRTIGEVMLAGETLLVADAAAWMAGHAPDEDQLSMARAVALRSLICAPLMVRGEAAGMLAFGVTQPLRSYDELDRIMVAELARRVGLALENARLYGEVRETAARERFLAESRLVLGESLDEEKQMSSLCALSVPAVADICFIARTASAADTVPGFDAVGATDVERAAIGRLDTSAWRPPGSQRTLRELIDANDSMLIADAEPWVETSAPDDEQREAARALNGRSFIMAPIASPDGPVGVMVWIRRKSSNAYTEKDRRLAEEVARRAGTAVEHARLYRAVQEAADRSRFLSEARRVLGESFDEDQQLTALCALAVPAVADICLIVRVEPDGRSLSLFGPEGATGVDRSLMSHLQMHDWPLPDTQRAITDTIRANQSVLVADVQSWADAAAPDEAQRASVAAGGLRSIIATPITVKGEEVIGSLCWIRRSSSGAYGEQDLRLAEEVARRVGTAIENVRLYRAVEDAAARSRFLANAREMMTRSLEEQETLDALVGLLVPAMADWASVVSSLPGGPFELRATLEKDGTYSNVRNIKSVELSPGAAAAGARVIKERKSLLVSDLAELYTAINDPTLRDLANASPVRSVLVVPIARDSALILASKTPHRYSRADVELMEQFATHATAALHNARLYGDLQQTAAELERANSAKDEFLGLVSHELKTPITTIYGNAEVLLRRAGELSLEVQSGALGDIRLESERLHRIVDNLLVLARLEQGQLLESEPMLLRRTVNRVIQEHKRRFPGRDIVLRESERLVPVLASPEYVDQVVRNLLSNAEKYSPPVTTIDVVIEPVGAEVVVRVLDRGLGIAESELANLFTPFYRSPANASAAPGAGIGLAVCQRLIEAQSGRIWARSREGGGSEFGFSVPVVSDEDDG